MGLAKFTCWRVDPASKTRHTESWLSSRLAADMGSTGVESLRSLNQVLKSHVWVGEQDACPSDFGAALGDAAVCAPEFALVHGGFDTFWSAGTDFPRHSPIEAVLCLPPSPKKI